MPVLVFEGRYASPSAAMTALLLLPLPLAISVCFHLFLGRLDAQRNIEILLQSHKSMETSPSGALTRTCTPFNPSSSFADVSP